MYVDTMRFDLNSSTLLRMAVEVIVSRSRDNVLQSVSTALAGTVWETMQEGLHAANLFGRTHLCGIQQGTGGEAGALQNIGTSEGGGAHGCTQAAGQTGSGVLGHEGLQRCSRP